MTKKQWLAGNSLDLVDAIDVKRAAVVRERLFNSRSVQTHSFRINGVKTHWIYELIRRGDTVVGVRGVGKIIKEDKP